MKLPQDVTNMTENVVISKRCSIKTRCLFDKMPGKCRRVDERAGRLKLVSDVFFDKMPENVAAYGRMSLNSSYLPFTYVQ